jgi:hypothetical protein
VGRARRASCREEESNRAFTQVLRELLN